MIKQQPTRLRCRIITDADLPSITKLLTHGFPDRSWSYWEHALNRLTHRASPHGYPRYGYLMEKDDSAPVGVILTIFQTMFDGSVRCNLSSWHIADAYRAYASLLVAAALRHKQVVYINVSPARYTWPIIEAQGFIRYCNGQMLTVPALSWMRDSARIIQFEHVREGNLALTAEESDIMREHVNYHCCLGLVARDGPADYPFLFLPRRILKLAPTLQLVYCRNIGDFARYAAPLGRALLRFGYISVLMDANEKIPGLTGFYFENRGPKYFKGPSTPRLGDLAFSESVLFGS